MKILFDNVENQEGTIYVSLDDGASYNQYELKNVWATGIEIPDDTDFSKVKIKARAEIFKNLFVVSGMKTLATYKIDFDIEKEMISYYKKTEVDSKLSSLTSSVNTSIDNINNTLNKSVLNVKASDEAGYITVLYNNGDSNKVVVGSPTDTALSSTSTNPVQNKVVNAALEAIKSSITTAVNNTIAQIVAESPEDFDTLKEIADWIDTHEDSASAMNTAILENKKAIANKADSSHTHDDRYYTKTEIVTKLNSPLPWGFNYLSTGYSASLHYKKIGEGYFTYSDNINWSFYSEIEMIHHSVGPAFERGTVFVNLRGRGSTIDTKRVSFHSLSGGINNLSKTKINYKIDTENKRIYLEILAYCYTNYTNILFRNSLTRTEDMLYTANNFWTFAANGTYVQSSTTMQVGVTSDYTEIPLSVVSVDKNGNDIVDTYATKTDLETEISNRKSADTALQTNIDKKVDFLIVSTNKTIAAGNYNAVLIIATSDLKLTYPNTSGTSTTQALTAGSMTILAKSNSGYTNSIFGAVYN